MFPSVHPSLLSASAAGSSPRERSEEGPGEFLCDIGSIIAKQSDQLSPRDADMGEGATQSHDAIVKPPEESRRCENRRVSKMSIQKIMARQMPEGCVVALGDMSRLRVVGGSEPSCKILMQMKLEPRSDQQRWRRNEAGLDMRGAFEKREFFGENALISSQVSNRPGESFCLTVFIQLTSVASSYRRLRECM